MRAWSVPGKFDDVELSLAGHDCVLLAAELPHGIGGVGGLDLSPEFGVFREMAQEVTGLERHLGAARCLDRCPPLQGSKLRSEDLVQAVMIQVIPEDSRCLAGMMNVEGKAPDISAKVVQELLDRPLSLKAELHPNSWIIRHPEPAPKKHGAHLPARKPPPRIVDQERVVGSVEGESTVIVDLWFRRGSRTAGMAVSLDELPNVTSEVHCDVQARDEPERAWGGDLGSKCRQRKKAGCDCHHGCEIVLLRQAILFVVCESENPRNADLDLDLVLPNTKATAIVFTVEHDRLTVLADRVAQDVLLRSG